MISLLRQTGSTGKPAGLRAAQAAGRRQHAKQINLNKKGLYRMFYEGF